MLIMTLSLLGGIIFGILDGNIAQVCGFGFILIAFELGDIHSTVKSKK